MTRPDFVPASKQLVEPLSVEDLDLLRGLDRLEPTGIEWSPGERGAGETLTRFLDGTITRYDEGRERPDVAGTSKLSPNLHFGEISPRRVWYEVRRAASRIGHHHAEPFLRQLAWREFSYYLLFHFPEMAQSPMRPAFSSFPWRKDKKTFQKWTEGRTGYPLVDAGMRELNATGWMYNRIRMIAASFLTKHLLIHWLAGAR